MLVISLMGRNSAIDCPSHNYAKYSPYLLVTCKAFWHDRYNY